MKKALGGDNLLWSHNLLVIDRLIIYPPFRGERVGLRVLAILLQRYQHIAEFAALKPFPLQFEGGMEANEVKRLTSPKFRMTPPPPRVRADMAYRISDVLDTADAVKVAKAVAVLPQSHRSAINWHYVKPVSPKRACQALGTTMEGLAKLVRDGRQMLINREA